jgi:hypothetical protein
MPAGGMAINEDALLVAPPQREAAGLHLVNDRGDGNGGAEIVASDRDGDAMRIRALGHLAEFRGLERAPPAAVDEQRERRRRAVVRRREQVVSLARRGAVFDAELGAARSRPIIGSFAVPAGEDLRMFRNAAAVVVFDLVVDRVHGIPP